MIRDGLFTSESVTEGHPDKMADQISDAILDEMIAQDRASRVACETLITTGLVVVAGEITSAAQVNIPEVVRGVCLDIGYDSSAKGFDANGCGILVSLDKQSPDISQGVTEGEGLFKEQGAGDQGLMFGYAVDETDELMPLSISLAHQLTHQLADVRKNGTAAFLRPDGKSQVTVEYKDGRPSRIDAIVVSTQHDPDATWDHINEVVRAEVIGPVVPRELVDSRTKFFINPTGRFVVGGPHGDAGLTGRKIIVDTYGGHGGHGGGAFSGKDPSKVDRSAAYMARYVAKNVVASGLAGRCQVQLAYAIGVAEPVSVNVQTFGTSKLSEEAISRAVREVFSFKPAAIIQHLQLLRPIFRKTAAYGHFGRGEEEFMWERTDRAEALRQAAGRG